MDGQIFRGGLSKNRHFPTAVPLVPTTNCRAGADDADPSGGGGYIIMSLLSSVHAANLIRFFCPCTSDSYTSQAEAQRRRDGPSILPAAWRGPFAAMPVMMMFSARRRSVVIILWHADIQDRAHNELCALTPDGRTIDIWNILSHHHHHHYYLWLAAGILLQGEMWWFTGTRFGGATLFWSSPPIRQNMSWIKDLNRWWQALPPLQNISQHLNCCQGLPPGSRYHK